MTATTPKKIGSRILKFLKRANLNLKPQYLELLQSGSKYSPKFCLYHFDQETQPLNTQPALIIYLFDDC